MGLPSDKLHNPDPISFLEFEGITIQDALIFQKAIRARVKRLEPDPNVKQKAIITELKEIDLTISVYVVEEIRKQEAAKTA